MKFKKKIGYFCLGAMLLHPTLAMAEESSEPWRFTLTPYLWAVTMDGSVSSGPTSGEVGISDPFFAFENLDSAAFLKARAKKGSYSVWGEYIAASYSDSYSRKLITTDVGFEGDIAELGMGYSPESLSNFELLFGWRFFDITNEIQLSLGPKLTATKSWADPFLGLAYQYELSERWRVMARADVGGFGHESDLMTNYEIQINRRLAEWSDFNIGYRYMKADFSNNFFSYDVSLEGVTFGLSFRF